MTFLLVNWVRGHIHYLKWLPIFLLDVKKLKFYNIFWKFFSLSRKLSKVFQQLHIVSSQVSQRDVSHGVGEGFNVGKQQMLTFIQERLYKNLESRTFLNKTITKNKLKLYHSQNVTKTIKNKLYVSFRKRKNPNCILVSM